MGFKFIREKNKVVTAGAVGCCLLMVAFPELTERASKEAISLWLNAVVPCLMPFFVAAGFLRQSGIAAKLPSRVYPLAMAVLSGYPMGARIAGDGYREGRLDRKQLENVLSYSMVTGPAFIIGSVGVGFLGSHQLGVILAVSHYAAALLNSLFYRDEGSKGVCQGIQTYRTDRYYDILTDAILDSFRSVGLILAYIMIFMIAGDLLQFSGVLSLLPEPEMAAMAKGFMEMTVGAGSLAMCQCGTASKAAMISFIISFGGLSVLGQSMSMLGGCDISFGRLFLMKLSHGLISGILTFSLCCFVL